MLSPALAFARAGFRKLLNSELIERCTSPSLTTALRIANRHAAHKLSLADDGTTATDNLRYMLARTSLAAAVDRAAIITNRLFTRLHALKLRRLHAPCLTTFLQKTNTANFDSS